MSQVLDGSEASADEARADEVVAEREFDPTAKLNWKTSWPFLIVQASPLLILLTGVTRISLALLFVTYFGRMFLITGVYHRYFSHKSYRLNRFWQFVFAFGALTCAQKGPLWWAAHHRNHHKFSDTDKDIHSPRDGFWWSHVGWILCDRYGETRYDQIQDFAKYPELRWLNTHDYVGPWSLGVVCFLIGGWSGLVVGFFTST